MNSIDGLKQYLEELDGEGIQSNVDTTMDTKVVIHLSDEDETGITLDRSEAELVLANPSTIERLHEALGSPEDASITLHDVSVPDECKDALERMFAAVDEF